MKVLGFAEVGKLLERIATALESSAESLADIRALMVRRQRYLEESEEVVVRLDRAQDVAGEAVTRRR